MSREVCSYERQEEGEKRQVAEWFLHQPWWLRPLLLEEASGHPDRSGQWGASTQEAKVPGGTQPMPAKCAASAQACRRAAVYGRRVLKNKSEAVVQRQADN